MNNAVILNYITFVYFFSFMAYLFMMCIGKEIFGKIATAITVAGFAGHSIALLLRWIESYQLGIGHAPLSNLYESLIFFSWSIVLLYLLVEWRTRSKTIGTFVTPIAFLAMAYSSFSEDAIEPLIPALQSNWLTSHVITCFFGYAAFALSFGLSYMYLLKGLNKLNPFSIRGRINRTKYLDLIAILLMNAVILFLIYIFVFDTLFDRIRSGINNWSAFLSFIVITIHLLVSALNIIICVLQSIRRLHDLDKHGIQLLIPVYDVYLLFIKEGDSKENKYGPIDTSYKNPNNKFLAIIPAPDILEELSYQMVVIGFLMLTLGIITGSVWANSAWGSYWSWDPKETWSLITWFVYAAMLHSRLVSGWRGKRLAVFSIFGFFCVIFTYLGVNLIISGLHSYA